MQWKETLLHPSKREMEYRMYNKSPLHHTTMPLECQIASKFCAIDVCPCCGPDNTPLVYGGANVIDTLACVLGYGCLANHQQLITTCILSSNLLAAGCLSTGLQWVTQYLLTKWIRVRG